MAEEVIVYSRKDGELIDDQYAWVGDVEYFDDGDYWGPVQLVKRTMVILEEADVTWYPSHWDENCSSCDGEGQFLNFETAEAEECPECNGEGLIERDRPDDHMKPKS